MQISGAILEKCMFFLCFRLVVLLKSLYCKSENQQVKCKATYRGWWSWKMTRDSVAMQIDDLPSEIKANRVALAQNKVNASINRKPMYSRSLNTGKEKHKEGSNGSEIAKAGASGNQITCLSDFHKWRGGGASFFNRRRGLLSLLQRALSSRRDVSYHLAPSCSTRTAQVCNLKAKRRIWPPLCVLGEVVFSN